MSSRQKKRYAKPQIVRQPKMQFPLRALAAREDALACRQCSSCHGCR